MPALTISGLRIGLRQVESVETGAVIPVNRELWRNLRAWLPYAAAEFVRTMTGRDIVEIEGLPNMPAPYYLLWGVLRRAGVRAGPNPKLSLLFTDKTVVRGHDHARTSLVLNGACRDITKSRVADVFADVFGYALAVDPTVHRGPMVEKSEDNGLHDGRVVHGPRAARPGFVYQRLVDNSWGEDGARVADLRCPTVFGKLAVVCIKQRPRDQRFANFNTACDLAEPGEVFSADELAKIAAFCRRMHLDWGGLDILRDRADGRIYIVDVNKTDMPVLVLPTRQKLEVSDRLARLLRREIDLRIG